MDISLFLWFNSFSGRWEALDIALFFIQDSYYFKGLFVVSVLVALHFMQSGDVAARRRNVYATLLIVFAAIFVGRVLQMVLPFSPRPLYTEGLDAHRIALLGPGALKGDSSFPSDHAVMFMAIAASVIQYARIAGIVLFLHATVVVCLPRIVLGFHWPSDILAGSLVGIAMALLLHRPAVSVLRRVGVETLRERYAPVFHLLLFVVLAETATLYMGGRALVSAAADFVQAAL